MALNTFSCFLIRFMRSFILYAIILKGTKMTLNNLFILLFFILGSPFISTAEFTISSYNCGGLSDHYDYLRGASMQKLMQERHIAEPEKMSLNEKIQQLALTILFSEGSEKEAAQQEWKQKEYKLKFDELTGRSNNNNPNASWNKLIEKTITDYKTRPIAIADNEFELMLRNHIADLTKIKRENTESINVTSNELLQEVRDTMAKRIFAHELKYDIICLQEGDYLKPELFPEYYDSLFSNTDHSKNGIAWNKNRFELKEDLGDILGRAFAVKLLDNETNKTVLVASAHLSGCNPFWVNENDSERGDNEIKALLARFETTQADIKLIGMDSNVTSLHPRLNLIKDAQYRLDYENYLEATCTNPYHVLNTRIDWIAVKGDASIANIPVLNVALNSIQTNMSDHKPIAAKIKYN